MISENTLCYEPADLKVDLAFWKRTELWRAT